MIRCYITDRRGTASLAEAIAGNAAKGVEWVQIREKDLPARELIEIVRQAVASGKRFDAKILVNGRMDVALAAGAAGVHLPSGSPAPFVGPKMAPPWVLIGVSGHTVGVADQAEEAGAES